MAASENPNNNPIVIPKFKEEFCQLLLNRFHSVVDHFFELDKRFTISLYMPDKSAKKLTDDLHWVATEMQSKLLHESRQSNVNLDEAWEVAREYKIVKDRGVTGSIYKDFKNKILKANLIVNKCKTLKQYFDKVTEKKIREINTAEKKIFYYFFKGEDKYISIPILFLGNLEGVAHLIFEKKYDAKIRSISSVKFLIKLLSLEYENLILDWDVVGENINKDSSINLSQINDEKLYRNLLLRELNYTDYYKGTKEYYKKRIFYNNEILKKLLSQYQKNATTSILIDSFAHNISAHSLTTLSWWFLKRAEIAVEKEHYANKEEYENIPEAFMKSDPPLAREVYPLLRFILEKGAFWNGITRDHNFGGEIKTLYKTLWTDFIKNPLYLGTIAHSEGVLRLNIDITIYSSIENRPDVIHQRKRIKRIPIQNISPSAHTHNRDKYVYLSGNFATIDLRKENENAKPGMSRFVYKGDLFEEFKSILLGYKVFFPGGIVGKHAFFTILENEIRNVKHYRNPKVLKEIRENGLTLHLSLEEARCNHVSGTNHELYMMGIWLHHHQEITEELIRGRLENLSKNILSDNSFYPILGGSNQDKACAAMLFNNSFSSIQDNESQKGKVFYPWIKTGFSPRVQSSREGYTDDLCISYRRLYELNNIKFHSSQKHFKKVMEDNKIHGYYKKFFHLWKGADLFKIDTNFSFNSSMENLQRFRFVCIKIFKRSLFNKIRNEGLIRIVVGDIKTIEDAYLNWLGRWLPDVNQITITFKSKKSTLARIDYRRKKSIHFYNKNQINNSDLPTLEQVHILEMEHGEGVMRQHGNTALMYRNHGILKTYFTDRKELHRANISTNKTAELLEVLLTRICIIDNRIWERMPMQSEKDFYLQKLHCSILPEQVQEWQDFRNNHLTQFQFLILHLSFIESLKDKEGKKYSENRMGDFISDEILPFRKDLDNFVLVITTGRGRTGWWHNLPNKHRSFVTFRPVESLVEAIERGLSMKDDIELKYRLIKVLLGS